MKTNDILTMSGSCGTAETLLTLSTRSLSSLMSCESIRDEIDHLRETNDHNTTENDNRQMYTSCVEVDVSKIIYNIDNVVMCMLYQYMH